MNSPEKIHHIHKIIIFTLDSLYSGVGIHRYIEEFGDRIVLICSSKRYSEKYGSFLFQLKKNFLRSGFKFTLYLSYHFVYFYVGVFLSSFFSKIFGLKQKVYSIRQLSKKFNIPIIKTNEPNNKKIIDLIASYNPDLIITTYFDHVIKKELINLPKFGIINVHTALLPDYKGPFPALWPLVKGEKKLGVTIHYINNENLDVGPILAQEEHPVVKGESVLGADCRLVREGVELAIKTVYDIENGVSRSIDQESFGRGKYYGYPTKEDLKNSEVKLSNFRDFLVQFF